MVMIRKIRKERERYSTLSRSTGQ